MNQNKNKCNAIKKLKLGVISEGMIGLIHIKTLDRMKECELIGISDPDISKKEFAEKMKVKYYSN